MVKAESAEEHGDGVEAVGRWGKKALLDKYKRTKDSRAGHICGKKSRFFQQLEALHGPAGTASPVAPPATTVGVPGMVGSSAVQALGEPRPVGATAGMATPVVGGNMRFSTSSTEDSRDMWERGKRKRTPEDGASAGAGSGKMMTFFDGLVNRAMEQQEAMQQRFLEAIEKREQDRMIREEAWRRQEMARLAREQEIFAQERAMAATRNAAVLSITQKFTGQTIPMPSIAALPIRFIPSPPPSRTHATPIVYATAPWPSSQPPASTQPLKPPTMPPASGSSGGGRAASSSQWPKAEVDALIQLRSNLDMRGKGLWKEVSAGMRRMGYSQSSQRCRVKWWSMISYFKKVKESNKKRSNACPSYFYQLSALYHNKAALGSPAGAGSAAAVHANAVPQGHVEASSEQTIPMPFIAAQPIRFTPPSSSQPPVSTQPQPQKPPTMPPAAPQQGLVVHQSSTGIVMTAAKTPHDASEAGGGGGAASLSLWTMAEVHALIQLRSNLDKRPKGAIWEEIAEGMHRMGYSRSSNQCMQKWWSMISYFKKVKKSNKKCPENPKTCHYFHQLETLYSNKAAHGSPSGAGGAASLPPPTHASAAPLDGIDAFTVAAPISQRALQPHTLPPVAKSNITNNDGNGHGVGGVSRETQMQASKRGSVSDHGFVFSEAGGRAAVKKVTKLEPNVHSRVATGGTYMWYPVPFADDIDREHVQEIGLKQAPVAAIRGTAAATSGFRTGYRGVSLYCGKYLAQITEPERLTRQHLGIFDNVQEAARAYDAAALWLYGAAAKTNFEQPQTGGVAAGGLH